MKSLILAIALIIPSVIFSQDAEIQWMTIEEAAEAQKNEPRKIILDVYTKWCGPCKMMMKNTFTNKDVIEYINANFYAVKFDAESPNDVTYKGVTYDNPQYDPNKTGRNGVNGFSRALGVKAYPTLVYMDENMNIIAPIPGYQTPQQLELYLKLIGTGAYETIKTEDEWKAYQQSFVPTFQ